MNNRNEPLLFIPGPVHVETDVREHMARPLIGHRSEAFRQLYRSIVKKCKALLETKNEVLLVTSSATGMMEAAVQNCVHKRVLCIANGAFGRRWHAIAQGLGKDATLLDCGDGVPVDYEQVKRHLDEGYDAVCIVFNETSTGIQNTLESLSALLKEYPNTLLLVDAVTGAFGAPIAIDTLGIDVLVTGTQKALALPPGLALALVSVRALKRAATVPTRGFYFDFIRLHEAAQKGFMLTTPNIPLLYALEHRLAILENKGMHACFEKHAACAQLVRTWCRAHGFQLFVDDAHASHTVTVIENTHAYDLEHLTITLAQKGFIIARGYGAHKDTHFRIGHMGDITREDTQRLLDALEHYNATR